MRHLITLAELSAGDVQQIFRVAAQLKQQLQQGVREPRLAGKSLALLFEKPSLRTRVSFESGMTHLGGNTMMLGEDVGFGKRESLADFARVLTRMVDAAVVRSRQHQTVVDIANHAACPIINGLTDEAHPCQALADVFTLQEHFGELSGKKLAWVGDGNNVARSLAIACSRVGMSMAIATPVGYELPRTFANDLRQANPSFTLEETNVGPDAVQDAVAVYTDVWASMGQEAERQKRLHDFADFQVDAALMKKAPADAVFMHCLPAKRGEEVTDEVIDGPNSIVITQAENRMHLQKGILCWLLES